ncbi:MAG: hypothetical protein J7L82_03405 [Staphylothermus sp.]|nr:hypothetical protein [Staphylothermus sp.]
MIKDETPITAPINWLKSFFERNCNPKLLIKFIKRDSSISEPKDIPIPESEDVPVSEPVKATEDELSVWIDMETRKRARLLVNQTYHPNEDNVKDETLDWINCHKTKLAESLRSKSNE